jgi:hypothetical protein
MIVQISQKEWKELKKKQKLLKQASDVLRVEPEDLPRVIKRFQDELKEFNQNLKG